LVVLSLLLFFIGCGILWQQIITPSLIPGWTSVHFARKRTTFLWFLGMVYKPQNLNKVFIIMH